MPQVINPLVLSLSNITNVSVDSEGNAFVRGNASISREGPGPSGNQDAIDISYTVNIDSGRDNHQLLVLESINGLVKDAIQEYVNQVVGSSITPERSVEGVTAEAKELLQRIYGRYTQLWNQRAALTEEHDGSTPVPLPNDEGWGLDDYMEIIEEYTSYVRELTVLIAQDEVQGLPDASAARLSEIRSELFPTEEVEDENNQ